MKNRISLILSGLMVLALPALSQAKVSDFNSLITENIRDQQSLHGEIKQEMKVTRESLNPGAPTTMLVESDQTQINLPTSKKLLRYNKEKDMKTVSRKKQMDRVSQEFDDADLAN